MKAVILDKFGPVTNLQTVQVPVPAIYINEVLIKISVLSINPVDIKSREGKGAAQGINERPIILGWDVSGVVTETNSSKFFIGDEVFGMINFPGHGKAYAEYVAANADHLTLKPANVSHEEAAGACLAALTALQNLSEHYYTKKGDRILIHAGSGGVGHYAVQLAKNLGAYVISTSSADNKRFIMSLGADEHIDYQAVNFEDEINNVDFVFNTQSAEIAERSIRVMKQGGTIISIASGVDDDLKAKASKAGVKIFQTMVKSSGKDMAHLAQLMEDGKIRTQIATVYDLSDMQKAHNELSQGHTVGKIVLTT